MFEKHLGRIKKMGEQRPKGNTSDYYFDSYAHFSIHEEMLKDDIRTLAYRDAIFQNPSLFKNKVVLDVGAGTGILSMFAAKNGAKKVYAVEKSSIVNYARQIIEENGFSEIITILEGAIEELELPEQVDVIISEWMGYALLYESMLPSVISARDRFMKPTGTMYPSHARMVIAAIEDSKYRKKKFDFWDNIYGFNYAPIKDWALLEPLVETVPEGQIITDDCIMIEFDLNKVTPEELSFTAKFDLWAFKTEMMHAFVVWFDVFFRGGEKEIELSTSPYSRSTHWSQTIFYLNEPIQIIGDEYVSGTFEMRPNDRNPRDQDFNISFTVQDKTTSQFYKMR